MGFELCVEPTRECKRPQYTRVTKDNWHHLQKVLSWISSGLLIERARSGQDKGRRRLNTLRLTSHSAASPTMSVNLEPSTQLAFQSQCSLSLLASSSRMALSCAYVVAAIPGPFTQLVRRHFRITNPNGQPVAFKIKTTAPKVGYSALGPAATAVVHTSMPNSNIACVQTWARLNPERA